jgi:RNA polymerase sigma-70 factor (ECF subfamily)
LPPPEHHTDPALLTRIAAGDSLAFAQLVEIYAATIYGHLLMYLKNAQESEEITQDILMTLWRKRVELPDVLNLDAYVFIITRHRAIAAFRKKLSSVTEPPPDTLESALQSPQEVVEYRQLSDTIQKGIDLLPPRRQEVFKLSRFEKKTYEEIAEQLGISRSAVRQQIIEALVFLRTYLREQLGIIVSLTVAFEIIFSPT